MLAAAAVLIALALTAVLVLMRPQLGFEEAAEPEVAS